jgi:hypothetical protein
MNDLTLPDFLRVENRDKPMAPKPLVYSYSNLNGYENCPYQMAQRYIYKTTKFVETPQIKEGNENHTAFELRVGGKKPLPPRLQDAEHFAATFDKFDCQVEIKLGVTRDGKPCDFWDRDCFFRGKLDLAIVNPPVGYMADWKWANSNYEKPFELETGALLLRARFPTLRTVKGRYAWIRDNKWGQEYDLSDFNKTWGRINSLAEEIENAMARGQFEKKPSGLCYHCDATCEHRKKRS